jgi:hypothetical protein
MPSTVMVAQMRYSCEGGVQDSETKAAGPSTAGGTTVTSGGVGSIMSEVAGFDIASYYGIDPTDEPVPIVRACAGCSNFSC